MAIQSAPYYWAVCDDCEVRAEYMGGEYAAWADKGQAIELAIEGLDWELMDDDRLLCHGCRPQDDES